MAEFNFAWVKSRHQQRVEEFMRGAGQTVPAAPMIPPEDVRRLRVKLIFEEAFEFAKASGVHVGLEVYDGNGTRTEACDVNDVVFYADNTAPPDLVGMVDGLADIIVVSTGALSACGVADMAVLREVDENNLGKLKDPGSTVNADGKLVKRKDYPKPDIAGVLAAQVEGKGS